MTESVIDRAVFDSLKETMGADYIVEVVDAFLEEAPALIAQLRPALDGKDIDTFRRAAHSVKSNAATFGATKLFEQARELEFMARENRLGEVGDKIEILQETYDRAAEALKDLYA
jgi:HPt (histidine-containing phosphotransfer) domain-containing protein